MPIDLQQRLDAISLKARLVVERYENERKARLRAEETVKEQQNEIRRLNRNIADLTRDVELLKVARLTSPTREDIEQSRSLLLDLVRDIDRCIADLTE